LSSASEISNEETAGWPNSATLWHTDALRVLHVFPDSTVDERQAYLGSTKDVRCRTAYFADRGISVDELPHSTLPGGLRTALDQTDLAPYSAAILENLVESSPVRAARKRTPSLLIGYRPINAEILHRWDWVRTSGVSMKAVRQAKFVVTRGIADARYAHWSDVTLSISDWEARHYWPLIAPRSAIRWVPFFLADQYVPPPASDVKEHLCVCLTSTTPNPVIAASARAFVDAVGQLPSTTPWRFVMTGEPSVYKVPATSRVEPVGVLASPSEILARSRALAVLSSRGYGFKTKLLEAVMAQNFILLPPRLYRRLPRVLHPYCVQVDLARPGSFAAGLEACLREFPAGDPNGDLKGIAYEALDWFFSQCDGGVQGSVRRRAGRSDGRPIS